MGYYFSKDTNVKTKQQMQEQRDKIRRSYKNIEKQISHMVFDDYAIIRNNIRQFQRMEGVSSMQVDELHSMLLDVLKVLLDESENKRTELDKQIKSIEQRTFSESPLVLRDLNEQSNSLMYQYFLQLQQNNTKDGSQINRRLVGNWVKQANRVDAIALTKLSAMPQYENLFSLKQLDILFNKVKSPAQRMFEEEKQSKLSSVKKESASEMMNCLKLNMAVQQMNTIVNEAVQLRKLAIQAKRQLTRKKRQESIENAPNPPLLLSLNELQKKTGLNYSFLRKMIVEEKQIPCL